AYDQAFAQYQQTVLGAFQNVADVLFALEFDAVALKAQADAEAAARESRDMTIKQLQFGSASYLALFNAQRQYEQAKIGLVQAQAARYADAAPEVAGVITAIPFQSGQEIEAGAPLVQLNAESDLARLQSLAAAAELAEVNYQRDQKQLEIQAVSRAVVDADAANLKSAKA